MARKDFAFPVGLPADNPAWGSWSTKIKSGTYDPTVTIVSNVDSAFATECQYMRVINTVTVSGSVSIDATAAGTTQVRLTLPTQATLVIAANLAGTGVSVTSQIPAVIYGDTATSTALFEYSGTGITDVFYFQFTYQVF